MPELTMFSVTSALLLFGFICWGVMRFGLLPSYSDYSRRWAEAVPMNNLNLWSLITAVAAFLLTPALLEFGALSAWQFLGFLVPVYLICVALTPEWKTNPTQHKLHFIFAGLCAFGGVAWLLLVRHAYWVFGIVAVFFTTLALLTGTVETSAVFWAEMIMFVSVYIVVLMALFPLL